MDKKDIWLALLTFLVGFLLMDWWKKRQTNPASPADSAPQVTIVDSGSSPLVEKSDASFDAEVEALAHSQGYI